MALINCPECGRSGGSESTIACPGCGYNIQAHFIRKVQAQEREVKLQQLREKHKLELEDKLRRIDEAPHPPKPAWDDIIWENNNWIILPFSILSLVATILTICICMDQFWGLAFGCFLMDLFFMWVVYSSFADMKKYYNRKMAQYNSWDEDMKKCKKSLKEAYKQFAIDPEAHEEYQIQQQRLTDAWKCPFCGSFQIKEISDTSRLISASLFGIFSPTINQTHKCLRCKRKW